MFAGPNGSGKSTLIKEISKECFIGYYINADDIEKKLNTQNFIDCNEYLPVQINQADFDEFITVLVKGDKRADTEILSQIKISEGVLVVKNQIDSYIAAIIAEFLRFVLLRCDKSFSFETVMSHPSKLQFLEEVKEKGFKTYLYFISTSDPSININRVKNRVSKGGHDVDASKIEARYYRSMELLADAFLIVDRAYVIDSSVADGRNVMVVKNGDEIKIINDEIPEWIQFYLLDKIL
ncbi:MAG: hypothetical protein ACI7YS_09530 [Flavobacterium sp.]